MATMRSTSLAASGAVGVAQQVQRELRSCPANAVRNVVVNGGGRQWGWSGRRGVVGVRCEGGQKVGFLGRLGRVIKEKAKSDIQLLFSGFSKTRENLAVVDELLTYWNLDESENILDELEEALLVSDFGPKTAMKIVDALRKDILAGRLKSGPQIKEALKKNIVRLLTDKVSTTELQLGTRRPAVLMIVGVNGGGKTTTIGKLANRFNKEGVKVLMAAGDTFRAAAGEQLEVWAQRTGSQIVMPEAGVKARPAAVLSQAVKRGIEEDFDVVLCDTSGRLHTNYNLMEELRGCKRAVNKALPNAPNVCFFGSVTRDVSGNLNVVSSL
ncbi:hypothetical protein M758_2G141600 [Ceratodon purpureus]|nr:hypothetical protein M758_2G141600 [Ceratodon purpureus]KAG0626660.1 hypothetical protein M758_2G141600 [Ceratodon purpureus]